MTRSLIILAALLLTVEPALATPGGGTARRGAATRAARPRLLPLSLALRRSDVVAQPAPQPPSAPRRARPRSASRAPVPLSFVHVNTGERLTVALVDRRGRTDRGALRKINRLLRCQSTGRVRPIAPRLLSLVQRTARAFGNKPIYVYSGYRARAVAERKGSYHTKGRAIDFRIAGVSNGRLRDFIRRTFDRVGVGYYPNSLFVHLDVRDKRSAFWVDLSGPGESAEYARDPEAVLRAERQGKAVARTVSRASAPAPAAQERLTSGPAPLSVPELPIPPSPGRLPVGIPPAAPW